MSRKTFIFVGMTIGSLAGGYLPVLFGAGAVSFASFIGGTVGGLVGIWLAFKLSS